MSGLMACVSECRFVELFARDAVNPKTIPSDPSVPVLLYCYVKCLSDIPHTTKCATGRSPRRFEAEDHVTVLGVKGAHVLVKGLKPIPGVLSHPRLDALLPASGGKLMQGYAQAHETANVRQPPPLPSSQFQTS